MMTPPARFPGDELLLVQLGWLVWGIGALVTIRLRRKGNPAMPLTEKGAEIKSNMEEQYGKEKGESVFYASKNKGTITGVDQGPASPTAPISAQPIIPSVTGVAAPSGLTTGINSPQGQAAPNFDQGPPRSITVAELARAAGKR
jgi:hypothetical protein